MSLVLGKPVQVIGITGGKGGVGKSNVAVNTAIAMADLGRKVVLLDADLGLANIDVLIGIKPRYTLEDVLADRATIDEVLVDGPGGIKVVPASSGTQRMTKLPQREHGGLIQAFSTLQQKLDVLIIDTAAGIGESVVNFLAASQHVVVVVCDEPTSITDAYALIKVLNRQQGIERFDVVSNMTRGRPDAELLFAKLQRVTDRFLEVTLHFAGAIPFDDNLRKAVKRQRAVVDMYPSTVASVAFRQLAQEIDSWPIPMAARGHLEFFAERLLLGGAAAG